MPHLRSNGINVYYEDHGSGEPLILIMGFTVSRSARDHGRNCEGVHPPPAGVDGLESGQPSAFSGQPGTQ